MPPPEAPPGPSVSVVVVVGGACILRYSRPPAPPPPADPPPWGRGMCGGDSRGRQQGPPQSQRPPDRDLVLLLRRLGPGAPPEPVAVTSFVGPEPRDLLPAGDINVEERSTWGEPEYGPAWPQAGGGPPPFAVELPRGPRGFGFSLGGGRDLHTGVYVGGLREGGPAQRCGRIQVRDQLLAINGAPTAGMTHAQALARIRGGGSRLRLLLRRGHGPPPPPLARGGVLALWVSTSPRGEPCFCLVGRRPSPDTR